METNAIVLEVQNVTGDQKFKIEWNPKNPNDVSDINAMFLDLQKKGYMFFKQKSFLGLFKSQGEEIKSFDPSLGVLYVKEHSKINVVELNSVKSNGNAGYEWHDPQTDEIEPDAKYTAASRVVGG